jgi:outer membrane protein assembly factor BamC
MMNYRLIARAGLVMPLMLGACSTISDTFSGDKVNYKTASDAPKRDTLEIPPDISTLPKDDHFDMPGAKPGSATASGYAATRSPTGTPIASASSTVLPVTKGAHIERAGGQRWLVVDRTPEQLWPILRDFWQENGFLLKMESPETGIMETDWAENQAKLPLDFVRKSIGKVLDSIYDTGERDKFRTRLERRPDGSTEIYISHRGMVEVLTSQQNQTTVWTQRPSDPELEAEFLRRLLVRLGSDREVAKTIVAANGSSSGSAVAVADTGRAHVVGAGAASYVQLDDAFDRAWRRVGLALDRVNFTVEDRDRTQGTYFVRYVDPATETKEKPGIISRIFSSDEKSKLALQYRILVKGQPDNTTSRISVLNKDGQPEAGDAGTRILALLTDQLK